MPSPEQEQQQQQQQRPHRIAVAQLNSCSQRDVNFAAISKLAREARRAGASMLFLPENCCLFCDSREETLAAVASSSAPSFENVLKPYRELAKERNLWLCLCLQEKIERDDVEHLYNTCVVLRNDGSTARGRGLREKETEAVYRKVHLFDAEFAGLRESATTRRGDSLVVVDGAPCGALGLSICYDLRFPYFFEQLRFELGASVICVPSAFTRKTGEAHWEVLLRARAIETQCVLVAPAQVGVHNKDSRKRASFGGTLVVDAWGRILAEMKSFPEGKSEEEEEEEEPKQEEDLVGIVVVDLPSVEEVRKRMPVAQHREAGRRQLGL